MDLRLTAEAGNFIAEWTDTRPYIIAHTSGSTGKPKEIRLLKSDMSVSAKATNQFFGIDKDSTLHLPLSPSYIAGKMQIVRALEAKCNLTVEPPSNTPLKGRIARRISLLPVVPSQVKAVIDNPDHGMIDSMIIGGAPLDDATERKVIESGIKSYATYGMTETCSHVALRPLGQQIFTALPGFSFSTDSRGCLVISSSRMSFATLTTNDLVRLISERQFSWVGRFDNVINSGGIKIFPEEIERTIAPLMPDGVRFYVTSRRSDKWGEEAVIVCDTDVLPENLLDEIKTIVPRKHAPKAVITDKEMRLTDSKKIIRRKF